MFYGLGKKIELFAEKFMLWIFEGGKSPFSRDKMGLKAVQSQSGEISLRIKAKKPGYKMKLPDPDHKRFHEKE